MEKQKKNKKFVNNRMEREKGDYFGLCVGILLVWVEESGSQARSANSEEETPRGPAQVCRPIVISWAH